MQTVRTYGKRWLGDRTHVVYMRFDHFINRVLWCRDVHRVSAGGMGLIFSWSDKAGNKYSSFASGSQGEVTRVYRISKRKTSKVTDAQLDALEHRVNNLMQQREG